MAIGLFSTYSTRENRVTASIVAVLRSLSLPRMERLLGALLERPELELVHFRNQVADDAGSVPDAEVSASFRVLVETKIKPGTLKRRQIEEHLKHLTNVPAPTGATLPRDAWLLLLTPDSSEPPVVGEIGDKRLVWASFVALDQAVDELLADKSEVVSEREAVLLRELQYMMTEEGLLAGADVVVVAARQAWPEYQQFEAYVCQPHRAFQRTERMAFYSEGEIHPLVPRILEVHDNVVFEMGKCPGALEGLVGDMLRANVRDPGAIHKVFLLSPPGSPESLTLSGPIANDLASDAGRRIAFTQGQRYVSLASLVKARRTSELVGIAVSGD